MKIINKISNFFSKRSITASIRNKLMMDWSDENIFLENRVKRENLRQLEKRSHIVYYFHSLTDPYSYLTSQVLENFINKYNIELKILFVSDPNPNILTKMHFYGWKKGLKTGMYYLRTKPKAKTQQFTIDQTKSKTNITQRSTVKLDEDEECVGCGA